VRQAPVHLQYETGGQSEYCLSFGEAGATRTILLVPPLFDEMNRTRRMLVEAMRALAGRSVRTLLPDLPGCNESIANITTQSLHGWRDAMTAAAGQLKATHVASVRGGALIDNGIALPRWRLAPAKGASILKTMLRTRIAADKESGRPSSMESLLADAQHGPLELAGYLLSPDMLFSLEQGEAAPMDGVREVTLADINGNPLWLRAEPGDDPAMSAAIADDLDRWSASCGG
jgi:pimeloyl-ACP methyl ester carboxylesterase